MTKYSIEDINWLVNDTTDDPKSFTPKFELPGEMYNQSYPKRLRHTFPEKDKWHKEVEVDGETFERWQQYIAENYLV